MSSEAPQLEVLLACFDGHKRAAKVRHPLSEQIKAGVPRSVTRPCSQSRRRARRGSTTRAGS